MKENINVLDELNKGACMGMDAIHFILDKVENEEFKKSMEVQYDKYKDISMRINEVYSKYYFQLHFQVPYHHYHLLMIELILQILVHLYQMQQ